MNTRSTRPVLSSASDDPFIIAEIGVNHDGRVETALDLVRAAADAGADAVKFQWFDPSELLSSAAALVSYQRAAGESDPHHMLERLQLGADEMERAIDCSRELGLRSIVTVFTPRLVEVAARLPWDLIKTASPDLINRPLLEAVRSTGLPMLLSTGGAKLEEVEDALSWIGTGELALLHCVSSYPTPDDEASLAGIRVLGDATGVPVGYSDHTASTRTGGLAVTAGATILEKHLTWNQAADGPDHAASIDPDGFARYVAFARRSRRMLGEATKTVRPSEQEVVAASRQSVAVVEELAAGTTLRREHLSTMRPGGGMPPACIDDLVGRILVRKVAARTLLSSSDLESEPAHE